MDEHGNVINPEYVDRIPKDKLMKIYEKMVLINEADIVFN